jgi:transcriptional regulator GlxA family with amidase domain
VSIAPMPVTETTPSTRLEIAIPIDDGLTVTDATNPYEVLRFIPGATVKFVSEHPGPKRADSGMLTLMADYAFADVPHPDVIVVPAADFRPSVRDGSLISWLRTAHETSRWTTSVCGGAIFLGMAGLLRGRRATTHWDAMEALRAFGAIPCPDERWVVDGKIVTAAGNSARVDMALWLTAQLAGETVAKATQLAMEYDPQPPFDSGALRKADPETVAWARLRIAQVASELGIDPGEFANVAMTAAT